MKAIKSRLSASFIKKLLARLRENVDPSTLADLLAMCDDDPARLATVLSYGKAQSRKQRARLDSMLIDEVNQLLEADHGDKINAGLNTAKAMSLYTTDGDLLQELRNTYYTNIIGKRSINALFNAMVDLLGESELATSMVVMQKALTDDLLSSYPSTRPTPQITALMSDASLVTSLSGLFGLCRDLHKKVNQVISAMGITTTELTRRVVNMTTSSFYLRELQRLNTDCIGQDPLKQLVFLNYFFPMLKKLPDILWPDIQQRNNTLLSVLRYMDQQTRSVGDFQFVNTADKQQQAVKNKLVMQAGVPVIEEAS